MYSRGSSQNGSSLLSKPFKPPSASAASSSSFGGNPLVIVSKQPLVRVTTEHDKNEIKPPRILPLTFLSQTPQQIPYQQQPSPQLQPPLQPQMNHLSSNFQNGICRSNPQLFHTQQLQLQPHLQQQLQPHLQQQLEPHFEEQLHPHIQQQQQQHSYLDEPSAYEDGIYPPRHLGLEDEEMGFGNLQARSSSSLFLGMKEDVVFGESAFLNYFNGCSGGGIDNHSPFGGDTLGGITGCNITPTTTPTTATTTPPITNSYYNGLSNSRSNPTGSSPTQAMMLSKQGDQLQMSSPRLDDEEEEEEEEDQRYQISNAEEEENEGRGEDEQLGLCTEDDDHYHNDQNFGDEDEAAPLSKEITGHHRIQGLALSSSLTPPPPPSSLPAVIPIKRGRGRPRKYPLPPGLENEPSFQAKKLADAESRRRYKEEQKKRANEVVYSGDIECRNATASSAAAGPAVDSDSDDSEMNTKEFTVNSLFLKTFRQRMIGRSSNSKIFELRDSITDGLTGQVVKEVPHKMSNVHQAECYELHNEFKFLKKIAHPRIISLAEACYGGSEFVRDRNFCGIVLPQAACNLMQFAKTQRHGKACLAEIRIAWKQVSEAVSYLHENYMTHNDIKPDNIFIFGDGDYKLADFGFAIDLPRPREYKHNSVLQQSLRRQAKISDLKKNWKMRCKQYVAPELIKLLNCKRPRNDSDGKACDVFALGVTFFIIVFYQLPYYGQALPTDQRYKYFFKGHFDKFWSQFTSMFIKFNLQEESHTEELKDLFNKMLDPNPDTRININEVLEHPWLNH